MRLTYIAVAAILLAATVPGIAAADPVAYDPSGEADGDYVSVSHTGPARTCGRSCGVLAASLTGNATGPAAVSGTGTATGVVAASGQGPARGFIAASSEGNAHNGATNGCITDIGAFLFCFNGAAVSGSGNARSGLAVTVFGESKANPYLVCFRGGVCVEGVAVSVFGKSSGVDVWTVVLGTVGLAPSPPQPPTSEELADDLPLVLP